jgi:hypothetical protein
MEYIPKFAVNTVRHDVTSVTTYLGNNSDAVVKIQGEKEDSLTKNEKDSVQIFLKDGTDEEQINTISLVRSALQAVQLKKVANYKYILRNMYH